MSGRNQGELPGAVLAIGVFDGVHRGHRSLLGRARAIADESGLPVIAVTFDPHPASIVPGRHAPPSLCTVPDRIDLLRLAGADEVVVLAFDPAMAAMSPQDFVAEILVGRLRARTVVVGENFRFGHRAAGDVAMLGELGADAGFSVEAVGLLPVDAPWSSTAVRQALAEGDVARAGDILGRWYRLSGTVVHGDHRGRELGYPTANLDWSGTPAIPADGVYAGWLVLLDEPGRVPMAAAISIGTNPQFGGTQRRVEAYVLPEGQSAPASLDLYGRQVGLDFQVRLRGQQTFDSLAGLVEQMAADVAAARRLLLGAVATDAGDYHRMGRCW